MYVCNCTHVVLYRIGVICTIIFVVLYNILKAGLQIKITAKVHEIPYQDMNAREKGFTAVNLQSPGVSIAKGPFLVGWT